MASIGSIDKRPDRPNAPWRVRYRDPAGKEKTRHFARQVDAKRFLDGVRSEIITGSYVDPEAGRKLFGEYAKEWASMQVHRPSTAYQLDAQLRHHILPFLGQRPIGVLRKSELQAWVKGRSMVLSPATVKVVATWVSTILRAAVDDGLIASSPFRGITLPKRDRKQVVPLTTAQVLQLIELMPEHYRALIITAAGTGLRQGELLGLVGDQIDWLGRRLRVDKQLVSLPGRPQQLGPPKSEASYRSVPLPDVVLEALALHVQHHRPGDLGVIFTTATGRAIRRSDIGAVWAPAARSLGLKPGTGMHALRHYYASVLISGGESVKVVQARLGHATAQETLETYAHLWPDSEDRTRALLDSVLGLRSSSGPGADQEAL